MLLDPPGPEGSQGLQGWMPFGRYRMMPHESVGPCCACLWVRRGCFVVSMGGFRASGLSLRQGIVFCSQAKEGHLVDALVPRGDEGRGTLR